MCVCVCVYVYVVCRQEKSALPCSCSQCMLVITHTAHHIAGDVNSWGDKFTARAELWGERKNVSGHLLKWAHYRSALPVPLSPQTRLLLPFFPFFLIFSLQTLLTYAVGEVYKIFIPFSLQDQYKVSFSTPSTDTLYG